MLPFHFLRRPDDRTRAGRGVQHGSLQLPEVQKLTLTIGGDRTLLCEQAFHSDEFVAQVVRLNAETEQQAKAFRAIDAPKDPIVTSTNQPVLSVGSVGGNGGGDGGSESSIEGDELVIPAVSSRSRSAA